MQDAAALRLKFMFLALVWDADVRSLPSVAIRELDT